MRHNRRLQSGQVGERMAEQWFANNGWHMVRTQPPVTILGMLTPAMVGILKRVIPRLAHFGHMVIARLGKGGVPDYTGYFYPAYFDDRSKSWVHYDKIAPIYRACEVKEAAGDTMPASRLDKDQRDYMRKLPKGCAWTGIFWTDTGQLTMHEFIEKGAYKRP